MDKRTYVRFEHVPEGRMTDDLGPFEWVQLTYNELRVSPDGGEFAVFAFGHWRPKDGGIYTDIVIWGT
jgi:hypothetical protein